MKILFTMRREFPFGGAYALRIRSLISAIEKHGHKIIVLCEKNTGSTEPMYYNDFCSKGNLVFSSSDDNKTRRLELKEYERLAQRIIEVEKPDLIITSSMYDRFWKILHLSKKYHIPLILESCERFHYSGFKLGVFDVRYIMFSFSWYFLYRKCDGVIAISQYLEKYFSRRKMRVIRIPTIVDVDSTGYVINKSYNDYISLLFAGSLSKTKDSIKEYVEAASEMGEKGKRFIFNVYGVDEKELVSHLGNSLYEEMKDNIIIYGYTPQDQINAIYQKNDFGIFFRRHIRSSEAGFSTKLGEGMAAGTPFIVNDTGDISLYIKSGYNGFLVKDESKQGIIKILQEILSMSDAEKNTMRLNAKNTANEHFNSKTYENSINSFITSVVN